MTGKSERTGGVSADLLKMTAMVTMVVDHAGAVLFPDIFVLRLIGRISFPIFVWLLVMGFTHTRNLKKYMLNMGIFAVISEIPFDLALAGKPTLEWQNIYFTLFLSLIMLYFLKKVLDMGERTAEAGEEPGFRQKYRTAASILVVAGAMLVAGLLHFDYDCTGPVLAAVFYLYVRRGKPGLKEGFILFCMSSIVLPIVSGQPLADLSVWAAAALNGMTEFAGIFAIPLISRYNGVRKWNRGKYFFYFFYPVHLLLLYGISLLLF